MIVALALMGYGLLFPETFMKLVTLGGWIVLGAIAFTVAGVVLL